MRLGVLKQTCSTHGGMLMLVVGLELENKPWAHA